MKVLIETEGRITKTGVAQRTGNQYIMVEAFVHIEGSKYPQLFEYYAAAQTDVLTAGFYHVPVEVSVRDGRLNFFPQMQKATRINPPASAATKTA